MEFQTATTSNSPRKNATNVHIRLPSARVLLGIASTALTVLIFGLISLGGLVRNAGAGLSCPDWPLCFGQVVPPMNMQVFLEWFHRLIAGSVSACLLGITATVFYKPELRRKLGKYCVTSIALLGMQIVLGGLTVLGLLNPKWVSSHLAVGLAFFGSVLWLTLNIRDLNRPAASQQISDSKHLSSAAPRSLVIMATATTVVLYGQTLLGALVSSNYAGLACPDFPTCNGLWIPVMEGLVRFQVLHRIGALTATAFIVALCLMAVGQPISPRGRTALRLLPVLLSFQIFLGVGSVLLKLPLPMSVAHLGTAAALFGMLLVTMYEVRRS